MSLLNYRQIYVLTEIMSNPGQHLVEIARACNLSGDITNFTLAELHNNGYIKPLLNNNLQVWYLDKDKEKEAKK